MILCCGEALVDMLPAESGRGDACFRPVCGGGALNTAVALARLGVPSGLFCPLSRDFFGDMLRDAMAAENVDAGLSPVTRRPTALAFVRLVEGQPAFSFLDEGSAGRMLTEADLPAIPASISAMTFGGISLVPEPCGGAYEALMRREHGKRPMLLDPNIRPAMIHDREAHIARIGRMAAMADIVKVSEDDLRWLGDWRSLEEAAADWLSRGPKLVLVTRGGDGVSAYGAGASASAPAIPVAVVDTVGAGDTFIAGFLASLHESGLLTKTAIGNLGKQALEAALDLGIRAAAISVSRAGANPPRRAELARRPR